MTPEESPTVTSTRGLVDIYLGTEVLPNIADVHTGTLTPVQKNVVMSIHYEADIASNVDEKIQNVFL